MLLNHGVGEDFWESLGGNQFWIFIGRTDAKAETPILWPPDAKNWLIWKDSDAGKDWGREAKGTTEDEIVGWPPTQWTWVWVNSGSWWWTGRPCTLQSMGSQRLGHDWATELTDWLNWRQVRLFRPLGPRSDRFPRPALQGALHAQGQPVGFRQCLPLSTRGRAQPLLVGAAAPGSLRCSRWASEPPDAGSREPVNSQALGRTVWGLWNPTQFPDPFFFSFLALHSRLLASGWHWKNVKFNNSGDWMGKIQ